MSFQPYFPAGILIVLVLLTALAGVWSAKRAPESRSWHVGLRLAAVLLLGLILLNPVRRTEVETPGLARARLLVDVSASMKAFGRSARADQAIDSAKAACPPNAQPDIIRFSDQIDGPVDGIRTQLAGSLLTLLRETSRSETAAITLISDACTQDESALAAVVTLAKDRRIPIHVLDPGPDAPANLALSHVRAPRSVRAGENAELRARVTSSGAVPVGSQLVVTDASGAILGKSPLTNLPAQEIAVTFTPIAGDQTYTAKILGSPAGSLPDDDLLSFPIEGAGRPLRVLYFEGTPSSELLGQDVVVKMLPVAWSKIGLQVDCWLAEEQKNSGGRLLHVNSLSPEDPSKSVTFDDKELPLDREWWDSFDLYVVSDVNRESFSPEMIEWVRDAVIERGAGFVMIGGNTSFDTGNWQKTAWEKIIPAAILESGYGMIWATIWGKIPADVRTHPLWQIDPDPSANNLILDAHPRFNGYHRILKAKPGATVLMESASGNSSYGTPREKQPLIMVQQYGRGRAMAFLSDAAGGWGTNYENWGPATLAQNLSYNSRGSGAPDIRAFAQSQLAKYPNSVRPYYEKFWQNSARWLAASSLSTKDRTSEIRTTVDSGVLRIDARTGLAPASVDARLLSQSSPLTREPGAGKWAGSVALPKHLSSAAPSPLTISLRSSEGDKLENSFIAASEFSSEFLATAPRRDLLENLALQTGGSVLRGPDALASLASEIAHKGRSLSISTDPAWARPWLWLALFALLCSEWALRRRHGS